MKWLVTIPILKLLIHKQEVN